MLETLFALAVLVLLPLFLLFVLLNVVVGLVMLPFKLLGLLARVVFSVLGGAFRLLFWVGAALVAVVVGLLLMVMAPLLPVLLFLGLLVALFRRPRPVVMARVA